MKKNKIKNKIEGFSKLTKYEKIAWVNKTYFQDDKSSLKQIEQYWVNDSDLQKIHDEFSENTISNFLLPLGLAPNFLIDGKDYTIPMAIEESSVVAAACKAAKFWRKRGGFKTKIIDFKKTGQVHFIFNGDIDKLKSFFNHFCSIASMILCLKAHTCSTHILITGIGCHNYYSISKVCFSAIIISQRPMIHDL